MRHCGDDSFFAFPSIAASEFLLAQLHIPTDALPVQSLANIRTTASGLVDEEIAEICRTPFCRTPPSRAELVSELQSLCDRYGEDCPAADLVIDPAPYALAHRVLPDGYRRLVIEADLDEVFASEPSSLPDWLGERATGAEHLEDVVIRILGHDGNRLRLDITGDARTESAESHLVENPMVPSEEVALGVGCAANEPVGCGSSRGGFTILCPRCRAVHEAQMELLATR